MTILKRTFICAAIVGFMLDVGVVSANHDPNTVHACVDDKGKVTVVDGTASCKGKSLPLEWNIEGPAGADGATGPQGPAGAPDPEVAAMLQTTQDELCRLYALTRQAPVPDFCPPPRLMDVVFLIDGSGAVGGSDWTFGKEFAKTFIFENGLDDFDLRFGVRTFGTDVSIGYEFSSYQAEADVIAAIDRLPFPGGLSNMKDAVQESLNFFTLQSSSSTGKALILITDGQFPAGQNPCDLASELSFRNIIVLAVGIGPGYDPNQLLCMVENDSSRVIAIGDITIVDVESWLRFFLTPPP